MTKMRKLMNKKCLLTSLAACLIFAVISALTFEALHSGHESSCHEEDCPVCLVLQIIRAVKKTSPGLNQAAVEFITFFYINIIILSVLFFEPASLVRQKVKLVI